jgi:DNA-binding response OmpR family regulator/signal transduction histidine kinase
MDSAADRGQRRAAPGQQAQDPTATAAMPATDASPASAAREPGIAAPATPANDEAARRQAALARAAHALKTPLAVIKGSATTLLAGASSWDSATQQDLLQLIDTQADRLHHLLNALLEIWRIEAGQLPMRLVPTRLDGLLEALAARWKAATPSQAVHVALPPDLPPVPLDAGRLRDALDRLVAFAVSAAPTPTPVRIEARGATAEVRLSVVTHARPQQPDVLAQLFEPLASSASPAGARASAADDGGLALARVIVHAHGGELVAEAAAQTPGIVFRISLPLSAPERAGPLLAPGQPAEAGAQRARAASQRSQAHPIVLLAGHPAHLARYLRANLEAAGYRPLVAPDMRQVTRLLDLEDPDLVLLDASLADASGLQALDRLTIPGAAPVVVLGTGAEAECVRALDTGAVDYLAHPFGLPELLARLRAALRATAATRAEQPEPLFRTGALTIDFAQHAVHVGDRAVALSRTEYKLLRMLAQHVGRVLAHELLLERVWGPAYGQEVEFLWVYVRRLRRKLEPDPRQPRYIQTIPGVGYRLAQLPPV